MPGLNITVTDGQRERVREAAGREALSLKAYAHDALSLKAYAHDIAASVAARSRGLNERLARGWHGTTYLTDCDVMAVLAATGQRSTSGTSGCCRPPLRAHAHRPSVRRRTRTRG
jgi:hypothetical protein